MAPESDPRISVIIPALNEAGHIADTLTDLAPLRAAGHQLILVDGGSDDGTPELSRALVDLVVEAPKGRARQMNAGVDHASGNLLWFLHADTRIPAAALDGLVAAAGSGACWGRFDIRLSGTAPLLRLVERMMNLRSRLTGIATGDQGIFVSRQAFDAAGGFADIPLMEDIALSRALRRRSRPLCLKPPLVTSSRRWERDGILRTVVLMWRLRLAYALGADPRELARRYYP
jgi:rSAM/selenodomain-associated transferase 2